MRGRHQVHGRSQIADFLCPDNGYRGQLKRQGKEVRDHMKENRVGLKEQQQRLRDKREAENVPGMIKLCHYQNNHFLSLHFNYDYIIYS